MSTRQRMKIRKLPPNELRWAICPEYPWEVQEIGGWEERRIFASQPEALAWAVGQLRLDATLEQWQASGIPPEQWPSWTQAEARRADTPLVQRVKCTVCLGDWLVCKGCTVPTDEPGWTWSKYCACVRCLAAQASRA